jgi:hypothetical protein
MIKGDLAGYTMLTVVAVPEPATLGMVALGGVVGLGRQRRAGFARLPNACITQGEE